MLSIRRLYSSGGDIRNITTCIRFRDCDAHSLPASQEIREKPLLKLLATEFYYRRDAIGQPGG